MVGSGNQATADGILRMRITATRLGARVVTWCSAWTARSPFVRFLIYGTWNTIWTFALYAFFLEVCGMNPLVAISIVWVMAIAIGYAVNFLWVYRTHPELYFRRHLLRYFALIGTTFALNLVLLSFMTEVARVPPLPAQFIVFPFVVLANFLGGRLWAFRPGG